MLASEAEQLVSEKHEVIYKSIVRQDFPGIDWAGVVEDLEALGWLEECNNAIQLITTVWDITAKNAELSLKGMPRFRVFKLSRVKVFVTSVAHSISGTRELQAAIALLKKQILNFSFFTHAGNLLKESTNLAVDFPRVVEIFEEAKLQLASCFIHLDRSYSTEVGKTIGKHMEETFNIHVISSKRPQLSEIPALSSVLARYNSLATTRPAGSYPGSTGSYPMTAHQRDNVYLGELAEGNRREGYGRCTYYNSDSYEGFWSNDRPHGKGVYAWKDGGRYEGDFVDGKMQGQGKRAYVSGSVYEGNFENGKKNGIGKIVFKNGDSYEGEWDYDEMSGNGVYTWHTGDKFTGRFRRDKREGPGVLTLQSGEEIQGEWIDGKMKVTTSV